MQKICIINKSKTKNMKNVGKNREKNKIKFVLIMMLLMVILTIPCNMVLANESDKNFGTYHIYSYDMSYRYIKYQERPQRIHEYYYLNSNSSKLPAYCMNLGMNGAETINGGYDVNANEYLTDKIINNIILNGYPYKTVEELGLKNESEARYATQFALWAKLNNLDINQIAPMEAEYTRVVEAIKNIYYNGINSSLNYTNGVKIKELQRESILDNIDNSCYSKLYELEYGDNILDINLKVDGIKDYKITDENNKEIKNIVGSKRIKIIFPREKNIESTECNIKVSSKYKEGAVLFAKSGLSGTQDVSLTLTPIKENSSNMHFKIDLVKTNLEIIKKDARDESIYIPGVKFNIYDMDDKLLGTFITDKNGKININVEKDLKIYNNKKIKIEEMEVPYPYTVDKYNSMKTIDIKVGGNISVEFKNEKIEENNKIELPKTGF